MPRRKIPVGKQPICDPAYIRRIDPIWMPGPVPMRFWQDQAHRRDFLLWLGHKLHFQYMEDYYQLTADLFSENYGGGVLSCYWRGSPMGSVTDCFPNYDWKHWLFTFTPAGFWKKRENRRSYLQWLGEKLGYRSIEDWYNVSYLDFLQNKGGSILLNCKKAVYSVLMEFYPKYDWKEWMFKTSPIGFWAVRKNRIRYMHWLGERLGLQDPEDWYSVRRDDFVDNHGIGCLRQYHQSPPLAAMDLFPKYKWQEWKFQKTPCGFWDKVDNRIRYMQWLGKQLGFHRPEDWRRIRKTDFINNFGDGLLSIRGSYFKILQEYLPDIDWQSVKADRKKGVVETENRPLAFKGCTRRPPQTAPLPIKQILRWADAFHKKTGQWPTKFSEVVYGAPLESWMSIDRVLRTGGRGLPAGSSLVNLLIRERGLKSKYLQPKLSVKQILKWADEYYQQNGKWPKEHSGNVVGASNENWMALSSALNKGYRGLPGGSSLPKLLAKHRGVRNKKSLPHLSVNKILKWAKQHQQRTGKWPINNSGKVIGENGETWSIINAALEDGHRGLPGGSSLSKLLKKHGLKK
jgi:hypothetical protein